MIYSLPHNRLRNITMLVTLGLIIASCGSYQQSSYYDNDGIYSNNTPTTVERRPEQRNYQQNNPETDTYSDYFGEKANQYDEILDSEIFTDVDSYSSNTVNDSVPQGQLTDYYSSENDYQGYGGWGDNNSNVSINIYDNGWNNWGYGGLIGWANPVWGWNNWGYGWNNPWRWNRWNNWGFGGFGYGYAGFGYGWNNPYYGYGYRYGYRNYNRNYGYNNRGYAYNNSRRGNYNRNTINNGATTSALRGRSNVNTRGDSPRYRSTDSRASAARSSSNTRSARTYSGNTTRRTVGVDQNRAYRTSRSTRATPRYNTSSRSSSRYSTSPNTSGTTRSSSRVMTPRTSTYRSSGNSSSRTGSNYSTGRSTRSSKSGSYRSSSNNSRSNSSGSYRSSGSSSSRSSGSSARSSSSGSSRSSGSSSSSRSSGRNN